MSSLLSVMFWFKRENPMMKCKLVCFESKLIKLINYEILILNLNININLIMKSNIQISIQKFGEDKIFSDVFCVSTAT